MTTATTDALQRAIAGLILLGVAASAHAQSRFTFPTENERRAADLVSWGTVIATLAVDTKASFDCPAAVRKQCFVRQAARDGSVMLIAELTKRLVPASRPCARPAECGRDNPRSNVPSEHMALAMSAIDVCGPGNASYGKPRLAFSVPLAALTGAGRYTSRRHDLVALGLGSALGVFTSAVTRCRFD